MIAYVPVIKGKEADIRAIGSMRQELRGALKPMVDLPFTQGIKSGSPEERTYKFCDLLRKHLPLGEAFVDFYGLDGSETCSDGTNVIEAGFAMLKACGRHVTPTYDLARPDALWPAFKSITSAFGQGFCFRLSRDDIALPDDTWTTLLQRAGDMGLRPASVDLMLDFRSIDPDERKTLKDRVVDFLYENPRVHEYRSVILSGSSARIDVAGIDDEQHEAVTREELHLWSDLWRDLPSSVRPVYSDYGVIHPNFTGGGANPHMKAKIRYTAADEIHYFRGHGLLKPVADFSQYRRLARRVIEHGVAKERGFSEGDAFLVACAEGYGEFGTPERWVEVDMNHHATYTCRQVQKLIKAFASLDEDESIEGLLAQP